MATVVAAVLSVFIAGPVRTAAPLPAALAAALRQALWSAGDGGGAFVVLWTRVGDQRLLETGGLAGGGAASGPGVAGAYVALVAGSFSVPPPPPTPTATSPGPVRHQRYLEVVVPVVTALASSSPDYRSPSGYLWSYLNAAPPLWRLGPVHSGQLPALQPTTPGTVPDVEWLNIAQALGVLGRAHLAVSVGRLAAGPVSGTVVQEVPPPGTHARPGEVVRLTLWEP